MKKGEWIWMPHAGHFICGHRCQFKLNTYVGGYVVSTVGEMPNLLKGDAGKFEEIGHNRLYETMVFKAERSEHGCCPYVTVGGNDLDFKGYNTPEDAYKGHMEMCKKWSK